MSLNNAVNGIIGRPPAFASLCEANSIFFGPINHSSAHSNIQTYVIKSVRTTISDLCLGFLMD